jgi:dihydroflavonol-4-reductase
MAVVFLTGASGFLGGHLLAELRKTGHEVRALSRRAKSDEDILALGGIPVRVSLDDAHALKSQLAGCDAVFHAAADTSMWAPNAAAQTKTNVQGTANMLAASKAAGVKAFIHTSSVSAYSHLVQGVLNESMKLKGAESWINYERTKHLSEELVRESSLPWIVFNPSNILGPGDRHNWSRLIKLIDTDKLPGIPPGTGTFADVREIARAQVVAWDKKRFGQCYLVGGPSATFAQFTQLVSQKLGGRKPKRVTPAWVLMAYALVLDGMSRLTRKEPDVTPQGAKLTSYMQLVDSSKAIRELGYQETPLDEQVSITMEWMRSVGMLGK